MFLPMKENNSFEEGLSLNTYGENFDFEVNNFYQNEYSILGNSIDYLIENKIMEIPDYIKIDVMVYTITFQ